MRPRRTRGRPPSDRLHRHDTAGAVSSTPTTRHPAIAAANGPGFEADELCFWTAGSEPHRLPDGVGIRIPAGPTSFSRSTTIPSGKAGNDRTRVGLYLTRKPIKQALHWNNASSYDFRLPAGDKNVEVKASWLIPVDVEVVAVSPHMHQLGRDMHMSVRLPSGRTQNLIQITNWDPAWQSAYHFQKPISLPAGAVVNVVAHFDNSAHSRNPNQPPKMVKAGLQVRRRDVRRLHRSREKRPRLDRARARDDLFEIFSKQRERLFRMMATKKRALRAAANRIALLHSLQNSRRLLVPAIYRIFIKSIHSIYLIFSGRQRHTALRRHEHRLGRRGLDQPSGPSPTRSSTPS